MDILLVFRILVEKKGLKGFPEFFVFRNTFDIEGVLSDLRQF